MQTHSITRTAYKIIYLFIKKDRCTHNFPTKKWTHVCWSEEEEQQGSNSWKQPIDSFSSLWLMDKKKRAPPRTAQIPEKRGNFYSLFSWQWKDSRAWHTDNISFLFPIQKGEEKERHVLRFPTERKEKKGGGNIRKVPFRSPLRGKGEGREIGLCGKRKKIRQKTQLFLKAGKLNSTASRNCWIWGKSTNMSLVIFFSPRRPSKPPSPPPPLPNVRIKASVLSPLANLSKEGPFPVHSYARNARSTLDANARFRSEGPKGNKRDWRWAEHYSIAHTKRGSRLCLF